MRIARLLTIRRIVADRGPTPGELLSGRNDLRYLFALRTSRLNRSPGIGEGRFASKNSRILRIRIIRVCGSFSLDACSHNLAHSSW